ncbi:MAG: M28 family peptidase [Gemmatimonadetes bacterium]|nr:M28 family peptidase [Gemmatimonadota bacterium]
MIRRPRTTLAFASAALFAIACGGGEKTPAATATTRFSGDSALSYARQNVAFGPRIPGTEAARKAGDWIAARLRATADTVIEQTWTHTTQKGEKLPMRNIIARFRPNEKNRVLYLTHWDTRPRADSDPVPANRDKPFDGANDGASGVGLFLALADQLKKTPPTVGVDLLLVDGEDWGEFGPPDIDVLIGSEYFATHLPDPDYKPLFGVLFDMIGDKELQIFQEPNSMKAAPEVVQRVWSTAKDLGYESTFVPRAGDYPITDDHIPLIKAGLRVIDVIDLEYPNHEAVVAGQAYHHATSDTMDKISAASLKIVGDVALSLVRQ